MLYGPTFRARNVFIPEFPLSVQEDVPVTHGQAHLHTDGCPGAASRGDKALLYPTHRREGAGPSSSALLTSGGDTTELKGHPTAEKTKPKPHTKQAVMLGKPLC